MTFNFPVLEGLQIGMGYLTALAFVLVLKFLKELIW